jgi:hypothetical protein
VEKKTAIGVPTEELEGKKLPVRGPHPKMLDITGKKFPPTFAASVTAAIPD